MQPNSYELQLAAVLAATLDDEAPGVELSPDELVSMARAFAPLMADAAEYYLDHGVAPEITAPAET